jgi:hypothetical protein
VGLAANRLDAPPCCMRNIIIEKFQSAAGGGLDLRLPSLLSRRDALWPGIRLAEEIMSTSQPQRRVSLHFLVGAPAAALSFATTLYVSARADSTAVALYFSFMGIPSH